MKTDRLSQEMLETMSGLYDIGLISKKTMHDFKNIKLLELEDMNAEDIKKLRKKENVSQNLFAKYLNISVSTIVQWEKGIKHPNGTALKLLNIIKNKGLEAIA
jgi:putative transcriptional regulator